MDQITLSLADLISQFFRRTNILDRNEKMCYGVTLTQHYVIEILYKRDSGLTMNTISRTMGLAISSLTRIINVLVRDGIVVREPSEQDRRKVIVRLTEKGKDLAQKLQNCTQEFWRRVFSGIPETKKKEIVQNLKLIISLLEKEHKSCCTKK
ncbi:MarR family transcriptional regulator [candidate division KSB1 bacterium]|nr:MarR family transcriptional regulator [candidate division KSB1 bacterium]